MGNEHEESSASSLANTDSATAHEQPYLHLLKILRILSVTNTIISKFILRRNEHCLNV